MTNLDESLNKFPTWIVGDGTLFVKEMSVVATRTGGRQFGVGIEIQKYEADTYEIALIHDDGKGNSVNSTFQYARITDGHSMHTTVQSVSTDGISINFRDKSSWSNNLPIHLNHHNALAHIANAVYCEILNLAGDALHRKKFEKVFIGDKKTFRSNNVTLKIMPAKNLGYADIGQFICEAVKNEAYSIFHEFDGGMARKMTIFSESSIPLALHTRALHYMHNSGPHGGSYMDKPPARALVEGLVALGLSLDPYEKYEKFDRADDCGLPYEEEYTKTTTLLEESIEEGNMEMISELIRAGADPMISLFDGVERNGRHHTPLETLLECSNPAERFGALLLNMDDSQITNIIDHFDAENEFDSLLANFDCQDDEAIIELRPENAKSGKLDDGILNMMNALRARKAISDVLKKLSNQPENAG
jgi:hypothetical protein